MTIADPHNELLTTKEAARLLRVSKLTLVTWRSVARYGLPYVKIGRKVFYRLSDVQDWLRQRTVQPQVEK